MDTDEKKQHAAVLGGKASNQGRLPGGRLWRAGLGLVKGKSACTEAPGQDMVRKPQDSLLGGE